MSSTGVADVVEEMTESEALRGGGGSGLATDLGERLRALADTPAAERAAAEGLPFVSAYVDLTPELDAGTRPFGGGDDDAPLKSWRRTEEAEKGHVRPGIRLLRDLLRERGKLLPTRGPARESFDADAARVEELLEGGGFDPTARGMAVFACAGADFWEVIEVAVPVETRLAVGAGPLLYPLARLDDAYERFALCIADSQSARVYVGAMGRSVREETIDGPTINYKMTGGWSQRRIQERIGNAVSGHVREVSRRLEEITSAEGIERIVLGGDEIMLTEFKNHLSPQAWERVVTVERLDIRLPADRAVSEAVDAVRAAEEEEARDLARLAREYALADGLGAAGEEAVRAALEQGAVDVLLLEPGTEDDGNSERRETLTEAALRTAARVEFVEGSEDMERMDGVAALLRWRPADLPAPPPAADPAA